DEDFDPLSLVASDDTLAERLLQDLGAILPESELFIAEYLVGSLDERGYLTSSVAEVAYTLDASEERVQRVLKVLQSLDPVGIGARNLRECPLIQLDHLEARGITQPNAREIITRYLSELGEHKYGRIAHELKITTDDVAAVADFIRTFLNPHPAHGFAPTHRRERDERSLYMMPDVVISRKNGEYEVDVVESKRFFLRVNPLYAELGASLHRQNGELNQEDKRHIQHYIGRAKLFIANLNQRRQTLYNITCCLVRRQREFLDLGVRHLKPLSRAAVANELRVHESTVSRATASKYVMLPTGEVIPYSHFFTPALSVKDVIKELIEREDRPLTDAEIAELLRQRGITIARRTVAKYRMQLRILPSPLR
ncbi:MAG TPA: RNA polymerase factor sigma-54, partial [Chloroflexota bacterium]